MHDSIPPIIHFIWLGSPLPKDASQAIESWEKWHPGWEIRVWTSAELSWSNRRLENGFKAAKSWAEKADLLRLEVLFQYGGIYSDTDVICLKSFDALIRGGHTFFAGLEMNQKRKGLKAPFYVGTAVLGAAKGSAIIRSCMEQFKEAPHLPVDLRSGPGLLSRVCDQALERGEEMLLLPCSYFYPITFQDRWTSPKAVAHFISQESLAVHLWNSSWLIRPLVGQKSAAR